MPTRLHFSRASISEVVARGLGGSATLPQTLAISARIGYGAEGVWTAKIVTTVMTCVPTQAEGVSCLTAGLRQHAAFRVCVAICITKGRLRRDGVTTGRHSRYCRYKSAAIYGGHFGRSGSPYGAFCLTT